MKFFSIAAAALIGTTAATEKEKVRVDKLDECFDISGSEQHVQKFVEQRIKKIYGDAGIPESDIPAGFMDNYLIRAKNINNPDANAIGGSNFVTVSCKYADWQDNEKVYEPYIDTPWNRTKAESYREFREDRRAMKKWTEDRLQPDHPNWPSGAAPYGRYRCGNTMIDEQKALGWAVYHDIEVICPDRDEKGAVTTFIDNNKCVSKGVPTNCGCLTYYTEPYSMVEFKDNGTLWQDRQYKVSNLPSYLQGTLLLQQPVRTYSNRVLRHEGPMNGTVYIFHEIAHQYRNGGWDQGLADFERMPEEADWYGRLKLAIWRRNLTNVDEIILPVTKELVGGVALDLRC